MHSKTMETIKFQKKFPREPSELICLHTNEWTMAIWTKIYECRDKLKRGRTGLVVVVVVVVVDVVVVVVFIVVVVDVVVDVVVVVVVAVVVVDVVAAYQQASRNFPAEWSKPDKSSSAF